MTISLKSNPDGVSGALQVNGTDVVSVTSSGVNFPVVGQRITGDFSNATLANRVMFQTSAANGRTVLGLLPNGAGDGGNFVSFNTNDPANASTMGIYSTSGACSVDSGKQGTGTYLPMTFYTGGAERMRIDTSGNVGIGVAPNSGWGASVKAVELPSNSSLFSYNGSQLAYNLYSDGSSAKYLTTGVGAKFQASNTGSAVIQSLSSGTAGSTVTIVGSFIVDGSGNATLVTPNGGLGYGTGSGGTVTQSTSKSTSVTLNKPTGQITMNNAALAAGATVGFQFNNTLIAATDVVVITGNWPSGSQNYSVWVGFTQAGNCAINVTNRTGGSLSDALVINFAIIKGATA